jgi:hypothetical protein
MKLPSLLLIGSLAVNAAVLALYFSKSSAAGDAAATGAAPTASARGGATGTGPSPAATTAAAHDSLKQAWAELQTGDLTTLVARLKAAGFSPSMIRSIVAAQVNEQFSARRKELLGQRDEQPFWKSQRNGFLDPKAMAALRELGKEQTALMKSLLGADALGGDEALAWQRRQFGNLAPEKLTQLQSINSDYSELQQEIYAKANGVMLPEDREKLAFLEKEKLADIMKTLTPQEYEDFQLRSSPTANRLREQLASFNVSEAEFRAIFKIQSEFDNQYDFRNGPPSPELMRGRSDAQKQVQAQILAALGPERAADYKQATDPNYQQVSRLVTRLELPPATTQQVVTLQQDIQNRARAIQTNRDLPAADRNAQLAALQQEATTKLSTTLTPRGLEAYKQNGGYWLENLKPRPMPTPAGGAGAVMPAARLPGGE